MSPYKVPPKIKDKYEFIQGIKIIGSEPHMQTDDEGLRYIYVEEGEDMYFNTETGEIRAMKKNEVP